MSPQQLALATALLTLACSPPSRADSTGTAQPLQQQVDTLAKQVSALQAQLDAANNQPPALSPKLAAFENISLWGYGEVYYIRPTQRSADTQFDLARAVFGIGYRFNDDTRYNSEYEVEHGVSSASDVGEFEVEQFYLDHRINNSVSVESGLFLIPAGLLNESHEPDRFYGVQRNFVETLIVPSTWREGGVALHGDSEQGLRWSVGLTSGLDLSKWDFNPETPPYTTALDMINSDSAPMQASHQELALANGQHLSQYLSLNYLGYPGLDIGGSLFTGDAVKSSPQVKDNPKVTLWELHGRWTPGKFDISTLYAHGTFSNTGEANALNPGASRPLPAAFEGYYAQLAYKVWEEGQRHLSLFGRAERYNMGTRFEGLAPGSGPIPSGTIALGDGSTGHWPQLSDSVFTVGANYYLTPSIVFKADVQRFSNNTVFDRVDLGMGLSF